MLISKKYVDALHGTINELKSAVSSHKDEISRCKLEISDLKRFEKEVEEIKKSLKESSYNCSVEVDFESKDAQIVTIERIYKDPKLPRTVLGIKFPGSEKLQEWYFNCSEEKHEELVKKFKTYINKKSREG